MVDGTGAIIQFRRASMSSQFSLFSACCTWRNYLD